MRRATICFGLCCLTACASVDSEVQADSGAASGPSAVARADSPYVITTTSIGGVQLGMTLDSVRRTFPQATFEKTWDGDGVEFVAVTLAPDAVVITSLDEERPDSTINFSETVKRLETFDSVFVTPEGVHVGSLVRDVERVFGPTAEITLSEIESRQFIRFARQPAHLLLRLDYSGEFDEGAPTTTRSAPDARIFSIAIAPR